VAQAYGCWGEDALRRLRGLFAVIIWDQSHDRLLAARDAGGMHPLFYAEAGPVLLLSSSIETLLSHPVVAREINRAGIADRLLGLSLSSNETYWTHIRRVPAGHVLQVDAVGPNAHRYWDPAPLDGSVDWVPDDQAEGRFSQLFEQAVGRCLALGPAGILLSGGLDSPAVAMAAMDLSRREGAPAPWALSAVYEVSDPREETVQRAVAGALGLPQVLVRQEHRTAGLGGVAAVLEMSQSAPWPELTIMRPISRLLAREARERGCRVLLTGAGGDEWLVAPSLSLVDFLHAGDPVGGYRSWRQAGRLAGGLNPRMMWRTGAKPLLGETWQKSPARSAVRHLEDWLAPGAAESRRRRRVAAMVTASTPSWLAPDPELRQQLAQREEERWREGATEAHTGAPYQRYVRAMLDSWARSSALEELFLHDQHNGVRVVHPYWDVDLVELLVRIRPDVRSRDGRLKALVRAPLVRRFPELGFATQSRFSAGRSQPRLAAELHTAWTTMDCLSKLGELGIVDPDRGAALIADTLARDPLLNLNQMVELLSLEMWVRAHS
jgi:asparagine synthase (glutamine-hydrolysing)